jgi:glycosyltransferase involved in cell wall biosynthesis
MLYPIKVIDIELSEPLPTITGLDGYLGLQGLIRLHGTPIGYIHIPITAGRVEAGILSKEILEKHSKSLINRLLQNGLSAPIKPKELRLEYLFDVKPPEPTGMMPLITVAVCTRNRTDELVLCLDALCQLDYPHLEILVVDNAPTTNDTESLIKNNYPSIRYIHEPRPGLDWARNRAIQEASGEIIAFTDDDVIVDAGWVKAIAVLMMGNPEVMAVTGLVVPYELETEAQVLFEMYGGFGRGFKRKWHQVSNYKVPWGLLGTGQFGTGANMAFKRDLFDKIGYFDPALDVGTVTNGGGDLEMLFRVLKEGYMLVYEPGAIVRHRHRREYEKLNYQLTNNSKGLIAYIIRSINAYPDQRYSFFRLWLWWIHKWIFKRLISNYYRASSFPIDLILAEIRGCFRSIGLYKKARKNSTIIAKQFGASEDIDVDCPKPDGKNKYPGKKGGTALRSINLSQTLQPLNNIADYAKVRLFVSWNEYPLGKVDIPNPNTNLSSSRIAEEIVKHLGFKLLDPPSNLDDYFQEAQAMATLQNRYTVKEEAYTSQIPPHVIVSVVIATYDRPDDLRRCLSHLVTQESSPKIEIIVVDNNPSSGLTPAIVAEFKEVVLVNETKKGLSYARNAGINASKGEIIISTDDDVVVPPNWIESLIAPFARPDVMIVTGNVLPLELETTPQHFFEAYGGLGRGFQRKEFNGKWFESFRKRAVPTWKLGACANTAFRASIFAHPKIGMIDESLGAGTPTGCSEDTYVFYKVLKLGYTIVYEPKAYVWHKHRTDMKAFRRQLYNYSKGHVAYHLKTWLEHKDWRGLTRIFFELPIIHMRTFFKSLIGRSSYPLSMSLLEVKGNLAGPWALFKSSRRVKRLGKSTHYSLSKNQLIEKEENYRVNQTITATTVEVEDPV